MPVGEHSIVVVANRLPVDITLAPDGTPAPYSADNVPFQPASWLTVAEQPLAEGDYVTTAFVRPEKDAEGNTYYSTWFDLYRIEDGKIAEHWDPMLKSDVPVDPNDKKI